MDEQELSKTIRTIEHELEKLGTSYNELTPKAQQMLVKVEDFLEHQKNDFKTVYKNSMDIKFSVLDFCEYAGISRAAIYKNNKDGVNHYENVIAYINSRNANFEATKKSLIKESYNNIDADAKLLNKLLSNEAKYQLAQEKISELELTIKRLKEENELLKVKEIIS